MKIKTNAIERRAAAMQLNYKQIAAAAGVTEKTLQSARNGATIRTDTAGRIAAALGVNVEELIK